MLSGAERESNWDELDSLRFPLTAGKAPPEGSGLNPSAPSTQPAERRDDEWSAETGVCNADGDAEVDADRDTRAEVSDPPVGRGAMGRKPLG